MGTYVALRSRLTCSTDCTYGGCDAEHAVSASYSRSSETVELRVDEQRITMDRGLFLQLNIAMAEMLAKGGM